VIIVSNTTPMSELAKVGQLNLLKKLFGRIIIPEEVYHEVTTGKHPAASAVLSANWIDVFTIQYPEQLLQLQVDYKLDLGEAATIILAEELNANRVLIDEKLGRKVAQLRNLPVTGTIGLLLIAKNRGIIREIKPILDQFLSQGKRISTILYQEVLDIAGES
jgi:predicted nucleic acid-binding protein